MNIELSKKIQVAEAGDLIVETYPDNTEEVYLITLTCDDEYSLVNLTENISYRDTYDSIEEILKDMNQYRIIKKSGYLLKEL